MLTLVILLLFFASFIPSPPREPPAPQGATVADAKPKPAPQDPRVQELLAAATASRSEAPSPPRQATAAAPTPSVQDRQWGEFLVYGPALGGLVTRSDEVNRLHAQAAGFLTTATVVAFYRVTDQAAQAHGNLKTAANLQRVPTEASELKAAVVEALRLREDAMNKLKEALDSRRVSATAAYADAKRQVDRSALNVVAKLFELCGAMGAGPDECTEAMGWSE